MTCARPGCSPRRAIALATMSSLRRQLFEMCSMATPAASATFAAFSRTVSRSVAANCGYIENADGIRIKKRCHAPGVADPRKRAGDDDAVVTRKNPCDPLVVAFNKPLRHCPLAKCL